MKKNLILVMNALALCAGVYGTWIYLTDFYYQKPHFDIGTKNTSSVTLRNVTIKLLPKGQDPCGILDPGQEKRYMDPPWPVPDRIIVTFEEGQGTQHEMSIDTGLPKDFRASVTPASVTPASVTPASVTPASVTPHY